MSMYSNQLPPLVVEGPPAAAAVEATESGRSTHHSIETLVVVLAVITILGVIAGIFARLCGGRHLGGSGEQDIEGWVERTCRSCIDGGVAAAPQEPTKEEQPKQAAAAPEDAKK